MNDIDWQTRAIFRSILRDIKVELGDEFDRNFEREAFFSQSWARRKSPTRPGGHILVDTGALRRSVRSEIRESSIVFFSDLPYASIHNEGGEIKVTARMKRFFWYKYYSVTGSFGRRKDGTLRQDKKEPATYKRGRLLEGDGLDEGRGDNQDPAAQVPG